MISLMSTSSFSPDNEFAIRVDRRPVRHYFNRRKCFQHIEKIEQDIHGDGTIFANNYGLTKNKFQHLYIMVHKYVIENPALLYPIQNIRCRDQLAICLRFLASGNPVDEIAAYFRLDVGVVKLVVREVANVIVEVLRPLAMPRPGGRLWKNIAAGFLNIYDMPNCLGSLSGQIILLSSEAREHVLLTLVDAEQRFIMIDLCESTGNPEREWIRSNMRRRFKTIGYDVPGRQSPGGRYRRLPFVIVTGDTFPPRTHLISKFRPSECELSLARQVYNYRIDPVKEVAVRALTRLRRHWQILNSEFTVPRDSAELMIMAACCLENYFLNVPIRAIPPPEILEISDRFHEIRKSAPKNTCTRDRYVKYFVSEAGSVAWQYSRLD